MVVISRSRLAGEGNEYPERNAAGGMAQSSSILQRHITRMVAEVLHRGSADPPHVVEGMANVAAFRDSSELSSGDSSARISLLNLWN